MTVIGRRRVLAAGMALAATTAGAQAQGNLSGPADPAGSRLPAGRADRSCGRLLAQRLTEILGQQVVVDNKPGVAGNIASQIVADAKPDGYTLLVGTSIMGIVPALYDKLPYDPIKGLEAVAHFTTVPMIVVAPPGGVGSIEELVAALRKEPGKHSYPSPGNGSLIHMGSLLLAQRAGGDALHVPYKGSAPAMQDTLAGATHLSDRYAGQQQELRRCRPSQDPGRLRHQARGLDARCADGAGEDRHRDRGHHLEPDLRTGRHAQADRRQAQRSDQPGDQDSGHDREGQGAGHRPGQIDTGVVQEVLRGSDGDVGAHRESLGRKSGIGETT